MNETPEQQETSTAETEAEAAVQEPSGEASEQERHIYIETHDDPHLVPDEDPGGLNLFLWASYVVIFVWSVWYVLRFIEVWR